MSHACTASTFDVFLPPFTFTHPTRHGPLASSVVVVLGGFRCRLVALGRGFGGPFAVVADQRPHDVDETTSERNQSVHSRAFLASFTLVELLGRSVALGAVERSHIEHFPEATVVALRSAQSAVSVS